MTKATGAVLLTIGLLAWTGPVAGGERIVRIDIPHHDAVYSLVRQTRLAVIDVQDRFITAYADDELIDRLQALGYQVTILVADYQKQAALDLVNYYTYPEVCSIMNRLALGHPDICRLETLGLSAGNRPILALQVTANPTVESGRPVVRLIGAHHGNEKISTEVTLAFMQLLCDSYPTSPPVRSLVDNREFWIVPILNPDGHVANSRSNGAGVDLNRDYGYEWELYSRPFTQPETRALGRNAEQHPPTLEFAYHATARYCNYLWDNTPIDPPDLDWIIALSQRYCDSTYGSRLTQLVPINGWDWYEVHGSCQDNTFGVYGALAWTIETQQPSTRVKIDSICRAHCRALLDIATIAGWGVSGRVYDSVTGRPLFARVEFPAPWRWNTNTNPNTGTFHKMLAPGSYTVRVRANGYNPRTFAGVVVPDTGAVVLDVALTRPDTEQLNYVQKIVAVQRVDDNHVLAGVAPDGLGPPDSNFYVLGPYPSNIIFDVDPDVPIHNRPGNDLTVFATGSYTVAVTNDWTGTWLSLGTGTGIQSFDLAAAGLDSARFLRLSDNGSAALDGVSYRGRPRTNTEQPLSITLQPLVRIVPSVANNRVNILCLPDTRRFGVGPGRVRIVDAAGRLVSQLPVPSTGPLVWDVSGQTPGVYFCCQDGWSSLPLVKLIITR